MTGSTDRQDAEGPGEMASSAGPGQALAAIGTVPPGSCAGQVQEAAGALKGTAGVPGELAVRAMACEAATAR